MPDRRTRQGVEIARVGTFNLSTGTHEFTREQLAAAMANAETQAPVIGIGHTDPRFAITGQDGDPAFGRVINLRLEEDGDLLVGDFDSVPDWLDSSMEIAYPRRSLEGRCDGDDLRLSSVKLLGTTLPGIKGLADLPAVLAASAAQGGTVEEQAQRLTHVLVASASTDDLRQAYETEANVGLDYDADWDKRTWVQEVRVDPDELIVRQDQKTYRVPWTANADGTFTFGDRSEVVVQYVDVAASADHGVVYQAPVIRPTPTTREESTVDPKTLREQLGLAVDASDEDVATKLTELAARPQTDEVITKAEAEQERELAVAAAVAAEQEKIAASGPTQEHLDALQADATAGREASEKLLDTERTTFLAAAVGDGQIPPAAVDGYRAQLNVGGDVEKATREFIDGLPKNTVPVTEIGASTGADQGDQIVSTGWFPSLQEA